MTKPWTLSPDRCFSPDPARRTIARRLYATVADLPIVSPHGHVAPALLADPGASFGSPADLFIIPDHYVTRMLYSQGLPLEALGVPTRDGAPIDLRMKGLEFVANPLSGFGQSLKIAQYRVLNQLRFKES